MTTHELARLLLSQPDQDVIANGSSPTITHDLEVWQTVDYHDNALFIMVDETPEYLVEEFDKLPRVKVTTIF